GMMGDGKALQMGTSHELGQNFGRAFDTSYSTADGGTDIVWQTSWGVSTRLLGGLIMSHGDDFGLRLPPSIAPTQCAVIVVRDKANVAVAGAATAVADALAAAQAALYESARDRLAANTVEVSTLEDAVAAAQTGFAIIPGALADDAGETALNAQSVSIRCLR